MKSFSAEILKIGINPYVLLPETVLNGIFKQSGKDKGPIPVRGSLNGKDFIQTLIKYSGKWRLYLNTPMRTAAGIDVGDIAKVKIEYDPILREVLMHPKLRQALIQNKKANLVFETLNPSLKKEIIRYVNLLKTEESIDRNVAKAIRYLLGEDSFVGRNSITTTAKNK